MVWYWAGPDFYYTSTGQHRDPEMATAVPCTTRARWTSPAAPWCISTPVSPALVGCLFLGKRVGYGKEPMPPHSLTMTMIGASLLWVGWFGFNAGSNLEANGGAALAFLNTFVATAAAAAQLGAVPISSSMASRRCWALPRVRWLAWSRLLPASGYAGPMGSIVLGLLVSPLCFFFVTNGEEQVRHYDDALDVFGVHCVGGIFGALMTGILATIRRSAARACVPTIPSSPMSREPIRHLRLQHVAPR